MSTTHLYPPPPATVKEASNFPAALVNGRYKVSEVIFVRVSFPSI